jgi:oligosaccharide repeat unit polymerase
MLIRSRGSPESESSAGPSPVIRAAAVVAYVIFALYLLLLPVIFGGISDRHMIRHCLAVIALVSVTHLIVSYSKNWMRLDTVFLLGYLIVFFQWAVMIELSGVIPKEFLSVPSHTIRLATGIRLASLGLTAWAFGHLFDPLRFRPVSNFVGQFGRAIIVFAVLLAAFVATIGRDYLTGAIYRVVRAGGYVTVSGIPAYIFELLTVSAIVLASAAIYRLQYRLDKQARLDLTVAAAALGVYALVFVVAGERGVIVQLLSAVAILYCSSRRPVGGVTFVVLAIAGALVLSALGWLRAGLTVDPNNDGMYSATVNLANSATALLLGIEIVQRQGHFYWGQLWLSSFLSIVPFAQFLFISLTEMHTWDINSANLIAYYRYGENPQTADGTTIIGDIYMNFGTFGIMFFMAIYGTICRTMQKFADGSRGFLPFIVVGLFAGLVFYVSRGTYFGQLRPIIWGIALSFALLEWKRAK